VERDIIWYSGIQLEMTREAAKLILATKQAKISRELASAAVDQTFFNQYKHHIASRVPSKLHSLADAAKKAYIPLTPADYAASSVVVMPLSGGASATAAHDATTYTNTERSQPRPAQPEPKGAAEKVAAAAAAAAAAAGVVTSCAGEDTGEGTNRDDSESHFGSSPRKLVVNVLPTPDKVSAPPAAAIIAPVPLPMTPSTLNTTATSGLAGTLSRAPVSGTRVSTHNSVPSVSGAAAKAAPKIQLNRKKNTALSSGPPSTQGPTSMCTDSMSKSGLLFQNSTEKMLSTSTDTNSSPRLPISLIHTPSTSQVASTLMGAHVPDPRLSRPFSSLLDDDFEQSDVERYRSHFAQSGILQSGTVTVPLDRRLPDRLNRIVNDSDDGECRNDTSGNLDSVTDVTSLGGFRDRTLHMEMRTIELYDSQSVSTFTPKPSNAEDFERFKETRFTTEEAFFTAFSEQFGTGAFNWQKKDSRVGLNWTSLRYVCAAAGKPSSAKPAYCTVTNTFQRKRTSIKTNCQCSLTIRTAIEEGGGKSYCWGGGNLTHTNGCKPSIERHHQLLSKQPVSFTTSDLDKLVPFVLGSNSAAAFRRMLLEAKVLNGALLKCSRLHNIYFSIRTAYQKGTLDKLSFDGLENMPDRASDTEVHAFLQLAASAKGALSETISTLKYLKTNMVGFGFRCLQREDPGGGPPCIGGVVWMFPFEKLLLDDYGDVLFIDATTNISKENYYYFPISGVNQHGQRITVARALLFSDKSDDYLRFLLESLRELHPGLGQTLRAVLSDQGLSEDLVKDSFPKASAFLCVWHLLYQNLTKALNGRSLTISVANVVEMVKNRLVQARTEAEFDDNVGSLCATLHRHGAGKAVEYIQNTLLPMRHRWALPWRRVEFCAGRLSDGIAESGNHAEKAWYQQALSMSDLILASCRKSVADQDMEIEGRQRDAVTAGTVSHGTSVADFESQLRNIPLQRFQNQRTEAVKYSVTPAAPAVSPEDLLFTVHRRTGPDAGDSGDHKVSCIRRVAPALESNSCFDITCDCNESIFWGIPCRHIFACIPYVPCANAGLCFNKRHTEYSLVRELVLPRWGINGHWQRLDSGTLRAAAHKVLSVGDDPGGLDRIRDRALEEACAEVADTATTDNDDDCRTPEGGKPDSHSELLQMGLSAGAVMKTKKFTSTDAYNSLRAVCDTIAAKGSVSKIVYDASHQILQHALGVIARLGEKRGRQADEKRLHKHVVSLCNIEDEEGPDDITAAIAKVTAEISGFASDTLGVNMSSTGPQPQTTDTRKRSVTWDPSTTSPPKRTAINTAADNFGEADTSTMLQDPMLMSHRGKPKRKKSSCEQRATVNQAKASKCTFCSLKGHNRQTCPLHASFGMEIACSDATFVSLKITELAETLPFIDSAPLPCVLPTAKDSRYVVILNRVRVSGSGVNTQLLHVAIRPEPTAAAQLTYMTPASLLELTTLKGFKGLFVQRPALE
jgi:hypothetical protein